MNLMGFCHNQPLANYDLVGLTTVSLRKQVNSMGIFIFVTFSELKEGCRVDFIQIRRKGEEQQYHVDVFQTLVTMSIIYVPPNPPFYFDLEHDSYQKYNRSQIEMYNKNNPDAPLDVDQTLMFGDGPQNIPETHFAVFFVEVCCDEETGLEAVTVLDLATWFFSYNNEGDPSWFFAPTPSIDSGIPYLQEALELDGYSDQIKIQN